MDIEDILTRNREAILKRWLELILNAYPAETAAFLRLEQDRLKNPVGHVLTTETGVLYDELIGDAHTDRISSALDSIIRIQAVQDIPPSQAIAFIFFLKKVLREEMEKSCSGDLLFKAVSQLETKIDMISLLAFDVYMRCREEIHKIRRNEIKMERDMARQLLNNGKRPDTP